MQMYRVVPQTKKGNCAIIKPRWDTSPSLIQEIPTLSQIANLF